MMLACMSMIWGGVCERHPKLRVGFLESGGGWIAPWLDRMDRHFDDQGFNDSGLKTRPSELFRRNCWISFEPVEGSLKVLAEYIGPNKILWATDYPHRDGFFPGAPAMIAERLAGASPEVKHQVPGRRCDGVLRLEVTLFRTNQARKVQLDHYVVVVGEEQLIDRWAIDVVFAIVDPMPVEFRPGAGEIRGQEREVIEGPGVRGRSAADCTTLRHQMHGRHVAAIEPITGEIQVRTEADLETENVPVKISGRFEIGGLDSDVVESVERHGRFSLL
jgi:hypothetical protein